jgi:hypothetical protein
MSTTKGAEELGHELDQAEWGRFFEDIDRRIQEGEAVEVTIEVIEGATGGTEAERLPLNSITYEDGEDLIAIGVGGRGRRYPAVLWHFAEDPRVVRVREENGQAVTVSIQSEDGAGTLLRLHTAEAQ